MIDNFVSFFDFKDKTILSVGAGGGQFIMYASYAKHIIAVDSDLESLNILKQKVESLGFSEKFSFIHSEFEDVDVEADLVFFEFCLHEMNSQSYCINKAKSISKDVLIADHGIESRWAYIANEEIKTQQSWSEIEKFNIRKIRSFITSQYFKNYEELKTKVEVQGKNSIRRIELYRNKVDIRIALQYCLCLI